MNPNSVGVHAGFQPNMQTFVQATPQQPQQQPNQTATTQSLYSLYNNVMANNVAAVTQNDESAQLQQQKIVCINTINQYNQLITYFQNAGSLSVEQQNYLQSLSTNLQIQQQHLQRIQR